MKGRLLFLSGLIIATILSAQTKGLEPLNPGDQVPAIFWGEFLQKPLQHKLADLKGKWIILDFWNIYCVPCFEGMKKLDSLQKYFDNRIQIVLVTQNNKAEVEKTFKRLKMAYPDLPMIVGDTVLRKLFPYESVPHHVWIDDESKVKYLSYAYNTNIENIKLVLQKKDIGLIEKKEIGDLKKPEFLFLNPENPITKYVTSYSVIMRRVKEYGGGEVRYIRDTVKQIVGIRAMNRSLISLFQEAYGNEFKFNNRLLLEVKNVKALKIPKDTVEWDSWYESNLLCYELILPANKRKAIFNIMQQDLNRYFPYEAKIEKRKTRCLVLKRITDVDRICSVGGNPSKLKSNEQIIIRNQSLHSSLYSMLANANSDLSRPLIDGTGYYKNIDIAITDKLQNIQLLRKDLNKFGLDLIVTETEIEMLVIRDK
jgi:thiol-disulfide isomerase/thioredoxin